MPTKKVQGAINEQIHSEFSSAYLYLSMAAYCDEMELPGFSHWMRMQSEEEVRHAMRLFSYLIARGGRVVLQAIDKPPSNFKSPRDLFDQALNHEQQVTRNIHQLYKMAKDENDYATEVELQWFITEQVEEEKTTREIVQRLKRAGDETAALLLIDRDLGARAAKEP